ncbi:LysR family transcriptional regulator [Streptomyces sp. NPDC101150]|uniref:LysR family transcriptional regulator n=1 Tax=Streptomyces sp. NPDC101150 TaxID=3366114 RepID=UPI003814BFED
MHFGRTATRLHLSRARVSQLIQKLERRVGAPLFTRTSRSVALTSLGGRHRDDLEPHYRGIEDALARAVASARGVGGVLHVGFSTPLAGEMVMKATEKLRITHPELSVEVCEVPLADPYGMLRQGDFDVQLADFPVHEDDLTRGPTLLAEDRVLAVAADHPLAGRNTVTLEDLAGMPLLTIAGDIRLEQHLEAGLREIEAGETVVDGVAGIVEAVHRRQEILVQGLDSVTEPVHAQLPQGGELCRGNCVRR